MGSNNGETEEGNNGSDARDDVIVTETSPTWCGRLAADAVLGR